MIKKFTLSKKELIQQAIENECKITGKEFNLSIFNMWYSWITNKEASNNVLHFDRMFNGYCSILDKNSVKISSTNEKEQEQVDKIVEIKSQMNKLSNLEEKLQRIELDIIRKTANKNVSSTVLSNRIRYGLKNMLKYPDNKWSSIIEKITTNIQQENDDVIIEKANEFKNSFKVNDNRVVSFSRLI